MFLIIFKGDEGLQGQVGSIGEDVSRMKVEFMLLLHCVYIDTQQIAADQFSSPLSTHTFAAVGGIISSADLMFLLWFGVLLSLQTRKNY